MSEPQKNLSIVGPHDWRLLWIPILSGAIFGIYPSASRAVYELGGNALFVIIFTTWVRALFMVAICVFKKEQIFSAGQDVRQAITGGCFQSLSILGIIGSLVYLPAPVTIIIVFSHTIMLLFFMAWRREVTLDSTTILTTLCALLGLSLVVEVWDQKIEGEWIGMGLALLAAVATASRMYVYGKLTQIRPAIVVGAENFLVAAVLVSLAGFIQMPQMPVSLEGWLWTLLASLSLALGSVGMFYGIAKLGAFRWSLFLKIEPIFTALFAVLLLHEILKPGQYLGMGLVIASLVIYQIVTWRRAAVKS